MPNCPICSSLETYITKIEVQPNPLDSLNAKVLGLFECADCGATFNLKAKWMKPEPDQVHAPEEQKPDQEPEMPLF